MKLIGIFGTSGMAREAGDLAWAMGYNPIYIARDHLELSKWNHPFEVMVEADVARHSGIKYIVGIGQNQIRQRIAESFNGIVSFCNLIHPSASFGHLQRQKIDSATGVMILAGARLTNNIEVGDFVIINQNVAIAHDVILGRYSHMAPGSIVSGNVKVGRRCWIGAGAVINQGKQTQMLEIGDDTVIGSGAVVVNSCESGRTYVGVPARRIK